MQNKKSKFERILKMFKESNFKKTLYFLTLYLLVLTSILVYLIISKKKKNNCSVNFKNESKENNTSNHMPNICTPIHTSNHTPLNNNENLKKCYSIFGEECIINNDLVKFEPNSLILISTNEILCQDIPKIILYTHKFHVENGKLFDGKKKIILNNYWQELNDNVNSEHKDYKISNGRIIEKSTGRRIGIISSKCDNYNFKSLRSTNKIKIYHEGNKQHFSYNKNIVMSIKLQ